MKPRSRPSPGSSAIPLSGRLSRLLHPDVPFQPQKLSVFYGWIILIVTTIGVLMSIPGQTVGVSVFTDHLIASTGLSRLSLSNTYLIGTLASGLLLPWGGVLLDRFGARAIAIAASLWLAVTLIYLSFSNYLAAAAAVFLPESVAFLAPMVVLILGFISLRFSGQGMLTMTSRTTLGKWFDRRRGFVSGLSGVFVSFGFAIAPLLLSGLIQTLEWRVAWIVLAVIVGVGMGSVSWLFFRDNPEECGLQMDGFAAANLAGAKAAPASSAAARRHSRTEISPSDSSELSEASELPNLPYDSDLGESEASEELDPAELPGESASSTVAAGATQDFTRGQALRTLAFWAATLALSSQALIITGITFHIVDIGAEAGLSETQTVSIFLPTAVISTTVGYLIGLISDRVPLKYLFMVMMLFQGIGVASIAHFDSFGLRLVTMLGWGVSGGCFGTLTTVTLPRFFGRAHLGAISGVQMMSMVIASALGPSFLAFFKEEFATYQVGLYLYCIAPPVLFVLAWLSSNPRIDPRHHS